MISDDRLTDRAIPGPGQVHALEVRKHITTLRPRGPAAAIELWRCPAHRGVPEDEKADEWAKLAADEPDAHESGIPWVRGPVQPHIILANGNKRLASRF